MSQPIVGRHLIVSFPSYDNSAADDFEHILSKNRKSLYTRRDSTECDMFITEDGHEYDPLGSCGLGAADVTSFALRIAMWTLNKTANTIIFDEPFRNLDEDRMPQAALLLSTPE